MKHNKLAIIGVGNMAKAIITGITHSNLAVGEIILFDRYPTQYEGVGAGTPVTFTPAASAKDAASRADVVLLSVKPQNYPEVLAELGAMPDCADQLYISIGAGITVKSVSDALGGARVVRVLPNVPMLIGEGVSVVCRNPAVDAADFDFVCSVFQSAGSTVLIEESEMNRMIGVTSSSPAYVFRFIRAVCEGAAQQGLTYDRTLIDSVCDMVIGSAKLLKGSDDTPDELIAKVASKGGTTEQALKMLDELSFDRALTEAMKACTRRAEELGKTN